MKILFMVRHNFHEIGGGDKIQVLKTADALERRGHQVTIATKYVGDLRPYDMVHLFNMMISPHSYLMYTLTAKRSHKPVALSTIYWNPREWLEHAEKEGFPPPASTSGRTNPFQGIELWRLPLILLRFPEARRWLRLFVTKYGSGEASKYVRRTLISSVDVILPNGDSEGEMVQADFGKVRRCMMIPNGVDDAFGNAKPDEFVRQYKLRDFVLHVGRIESRKNLIPLVAAVRKLGLSLVLIGNDTAEPAYTEAVRKAAPDNTLYIADMPHEQLGSAYAAAKVHALASWFETPGLASLEAGLAGTNVVTTDRGTTKEYFSDLAWYCDPTKPESIERAVKAAFAAPHGGKLREHLLKNFTWDKVAEKTEHAYREVMK